MILRNLNSLVLRRAKTSELLATDLVLVVDHALVHITTYGVIYSVHSKVMTMLNGQISFLLNASTNIIPSI